MNVFADILLAPEILPPEPLVVILFAVILPDTLVLPPDTLMLPTTLALPMKLEYPLTDSAVNNPKLVILPCEALTTAPAYAE